jgi:hypothetical protein
MLTDDSEKKDYDLYLGIDSSERKQRQQMVAQSRTIRAREIVTSMKLRRNTIVLSIHIKYHIIVYCMTEGHGHINQRLQHYFFLTFASSIEPTEASLLERRDLLVVRVAGDISK